MRTFATILALSATLAACGSLADRPREQARATQQGVAIVSMTVSGEASGVPTHLRYRLSSAEAPAAPAASERYFSSVRDHARWVSREGARRAAGSRTVDVIGAGQTAGLIEEGGRPIGRVVVLRLPAGSYVLDRWALVLPGRDGTRVLRAADSTAYRFELETGRVAYLGNLDLRIDADGGYAMTVRDATRRDLALAARAGFAFEEVGYRPLVGAP